MWLGAIVLAGCPPAQTEPEITYELELRADELPDRPGDPLRLAATLVRSHDGIEVGLCDEEGLEDSEYGCDAYSALVEPVLVDTSDAQATVLALSDAEGAVWAWTVEADTPPGVYRVVEVAEYPGVPLAEPLAFELGDVGQADPFDASALTGTVWALGPYRTAPLDLGATAADLHPPMLLEVVSADAEGADFRIVSREQTRDCVVLSARGAWTRSELGWAADTVQVEHPELGTLTAQDLWLSVAWGSDPDVADARASVTIDTAPLGPLVEDPGDEASVCDLLVGFGAHCVTCDSGSPYCVSAHGYDGVLQRSTEFLPDVLPLCGLELPETGLGDIQLDCDVEIDDCGCRSLAPPTALPFAWLLLWVTRRRTRQRATLRSGGARERAAEPPS